MNRIFLILLLAGFVSAAAAQDSRTPLEIVNNRMAAHNDHALERFLSVYADDVRIYTYPDLLLNQGRDNLRALFEGRFQEGSDLAVVIHHQIAKDSYVINHETVIFEGEETEYVSIYEVRDGLINSVRFVRD